MVQVEDGWALAKADATQASNSSQWVWQGRKLRHCNVLLVCDHRSILFVLSRHALIVLCQPHSTPELRQTRLCFSVRLSNLYAAMRAMPLATWQKRGPSERICPLGLRQLGPRTRHERARRALSRPIALLRPPAPGPGGPFAGGGSCSATLREIGRAFPTVLSFLWRALSWPWVITYASILGRRNTHVPPISMFTRGTGF